MYNKVCRKARVRQNLIMMMKLRNSGWKWKCITQIRNSWGVWIHATQLRHHTKATLKWRIILFCIVIYKCYCALSQVSTRFFLNKEKDNQLHENSKTMRYILWTFLIQVNVSTNETGIKTFILKISFWGNNYIFMRKLCNV